MRERKNPVKCPTPEECTAKDDDDSYNHVPPKVVAMAKAAPAGKRDTSRDRWVWSDKSKDPERYVPYSQLEAVQRTLAPEVILAEFERRMDSCAEANQDTSMSLVYRFAVGTLRDIVRFPHLIGTTPSLDLPSPYEPPPGPPKTDTELLEAILREEVMVSSFEDPKHGVCRSLETWSAIDEALYAKGLRPRPERKKKDCP